MLPKAPKKTQKKQQDDPVKREETFEEGAEKADAVTRKMLLPALCMPDETTEQMVCSILFHFIYNKQKNRLMDQPPEASPKGQFIKPESFEQPKAVDDADADAANMMKDLEALIGDARKEVEKSEKERQSPRKR